MSTRSRNVKEKPSEKNKPNKKVLGDQKVFFIRDELLDVDESGSSNISIDIVSLRNPGTDEKSMYLFSNDNKKMFEVMQFDDNYRSWFINKTLCPNGKIYFTTPIDPLFMLLNYVYKECQTRAIPLDQLLKDDNFPDSTRLINTISTAQIGLIGDTKSFGDVIAIQYNEDKTLKWLEKKVNNLVKILKEMKIYVGHGAISSTYVKSEKLEETHDPIEYIRYGHGIISDYLLEELSLKLQKALDIPQENVLTSLKRKSQMNDSKKPNKKNKLSLDIVDNDDENDEQTIQENVDNNKSFDTSIEKKDNSFTEKKVSAKEKALAKAASGTKSISSFFKKG